MSASRYEVSQMPASARWGSGSGVSTIPVTRVLGLEALRGPSLRRTWAGCAANCTGERPRLDRRLARYLMSFSMDWNSAFMAWRVNQTWVAEFLGPFGVVEADRKNVAGVNFLSAA